jgi:hypothetical protein
LVGENKKISEKLFPMGGIVWAPDILVEILMENQLECGMLLQKLQDKSKRRITPLSFGHHMNMDQS